MQKITPFLWFNDNAGEALNFYTSVFKDSRVVNKVTYGKVGPGREGELMTATFILNGVEFMALNGGSHYDFSPATSLFVKCKDQQEVDHYWNHLLDGGTAMQCGWLTDKFGVTWQIIPDRLMELMQSEDPARASRVMQAMMKMVKIDISLLEKAYHDE